MSKNDITAVVVTYNRLNLLKMSLSSILNQNHNLKNLIVVDNASTDGTREYLKNLEQKEKNIVGIYLEKNIGGSGGFYEGIKKAIELECDWVWIMDDDTIVRKNSLEKLINEVSCYENIGFLCSKVLWNNDDVHYMNIPFSVPLLNGNPFNQYDDKLLVKSCSFVSVLINSEVIREIGLPYKEFFIWSDDSEYTQRITNNGYLGVYVAESIVEHHTATNYCVDLLNDEPRNYWKYFYGTRNELFLIKKENKVKYIYNLFKNIFIIVPKIYKSKKEEKFRLANIVIKASFKSIFFNPKIDKLN